MAWVNTVQKDWVEQSAQWLVCSVCDSEYLQANANQTDTCGKPECKREHKRKYLKRRRERLRGKR